MHYRVLLALVLSVSLLSGCGGGGGGSSTPGGGGGSNGGGSTLAPTGGSITLPTSNGITPTFAYASVSPSGVKVTFAATNNGPTPYSNARKPMAGSALAAYTFTVSGSTSTVTLGASTLSYSGSATNLILEIFDVTQLNNTNFANPVATCPETSSSGTITFTCSAVSITNPTDTYAFEIVSGSNLVSANAFTCPTSDTSSSIARSSGPSAIEATHHGLVHLNRSTAAVTGQIAVVYDRATFQRSSASFVRNEQSAGGSLSRSFDYPQLGKTIHVLGVPASQSAAAIAALRSQAGVLSVTPTQRRYAYTSQPLMVNNHYFLGFSPANVAPYYESASLPGQWDMHAIQMEYAFGYSQGGNTAPGGSSGFPNALGTHSTKIAIIDTGEDPTHPDLSANIVYQKCFITSANGSSQSTSNFETDPFGHGTDVSGIAAAVTNPTNIPSTSNGFAGAGGNSGIMAYRVFPTPDDSCEDANGGDDQCGASTSDIASAINDAVANGAKVISMSLGGGGCNSGVDTDPTEGTAVEAAITANVVVVAASGNESASTVDAPGCDTGVIAVGATSLDDGTANGSSRNAGGTANSPVEYVASYSNDGSTNTLNSPSSWGIVAPGGDPASDTDEDDLHWIENIWTSTPYMLNSTDTTYAGECTDDYPNSTLTNSPVDCRTLIAGTSMATPHVAGVAALICGLNSADCNPTSMKMLLCQTADQLNDPRQGCGRLNAYRAVAVALGDADPH